LNCRPLPYQGRSQVALTSGSCLRILCGHTLLPEFFPWPLLMRTGAACWSDADIGTAGRNDARGGSTEDSSWPAEMRGSSAFPGRTVRIPASRRVVHHWYSRQRSISQSMKRSKLGTAAGPRLHGEIGEARLDVFVPSAWTAAACSFSTILGQSLGGYSKSEVDAALELRVSGLQRQ
jgi:hypothetical protein